MGDNYRWMGIRTMYFIKEIRNWEIYFVWFRFSVDIQDVLGFDWIMLFMKENVNCSTVVRALRLLVIILSEGGALERFREGYCNGGWLRGTETLSSKTFHVVAGKRSGKCLFRLVSFAFIPCIFPLDRCSIDARKRWFVLTFVRLFVRSVVRSFVRSFVRLYVCTFVRSSVHKFVRSFVSSFVSSFVRWLVCLSVR